jgi:hypothetical protein
MGRLLKLTTNDKIAKIDINSLAIMLNYVNFLNYAQYVILHSVVNV